MASTPHLNLDSENLRKVKQILHRVIPEVEVRAYGSRVRGGAEKYSDLDLAIMGQAGPIPGKLEELKNLFSLSNIPIKVDVSDWANLPASIRKEIEERSVVVQKAQKLDGKGYIYHYTSIDALRHILKERRLMLKRLDLQDDLLEGVTTEYKSETAKCIYVSCWTIDETENVAHWRLYGDNFRGVRIGLPRSPFLINMDDETIGESPKLIRLSDETGMPTGGYVEGYLSGPDNVDYREDAFQQSLFEEEKENGDLVIHPEYGYVKMPYFSFEKECRFCLRVIPAEFNNGFSSKFLMERRYLASADQFEQQVYLRIHNQVFHQLSVTFGPHCPETDKDLIRTIVRQSGAKVDMDESVILYRQPPEA